MNSSLSQEPLALLKGIKYDVTVDGVQTYTAQAIWSQGLMVYDLEGKELVRIMTVFNWFKPKMLLRFADGSQANYSTITVWKKHYKLEHAGDTYDIYGHSQRRASIYRNNEQVAWYQKNAVAVMAGDVFNATCNHDVNKLIVVCLMLIRDMTKPSKNKATVNVDGGSFGPF